MPRFKLTIEYDGRPYVGWQRQDNGLSVQQVIEDAIGNLVDHDVLVYGSGRTDAGVHALGMVAHVDVERDIDAFKLIAAINYHMREAPVSILACEQVGEDFHARFDAVKRHYTYRILNRRASPSFQRGLVWHVPHDLDADAMHDAAQILVGKHDFTTFRTVNCQAKSPIKTLERLDVERKGEIIEIHASARSFLHHQIRSMVGTLKLVGEGKRTKADVQAALAAKDRQRLGLNCPSDGLYFTGVEY